MEEVWNWVIFFLIILSLAIMIIFQLTCLADLEFDYINPYDTASRVNAVILPEFITQGVLTVLFLLRGHWVMSLLSIPYLYYNVRLYEPLETRRPNKENEPIELERGEYKPTFSWVIQEKR